MRLYRDLAPWFHLITHPSEYVDEADHLLRLVDAADIGTAKTLLELGSGGGNLASHLTQRFACTLTDLSEDMLKLSRGINQDAEHIAADMRSLRLGREFDVVLAHDAIGYMTSEADLGAAIMTAAIHLRPGGLAVFIPDAVTEQLRAGTDDGGVDGADGRGARYLEWTHGINEDGHSYDVDYVFLLREPGKPPRAELDTHRLGVFPRHTWLDLIGAAGLMPLRLTVEDPDEAEHAVFTARRPE
jgi:SAM-dependent methyltransferase